MKDKKEVGRQEPNRIEAESEHRKRRNKAEKNLDNWEVKLKKIQVTKDANQKKNPGNREPNKIKTKNKK